MAKQQYSGITRDSSYDGATRYWSLSSAGNDCVLG
jgi:hypothetical protein